MKSRVLSSLFAVGLLVAFAVQAHAGPGQKAANQKAGVQKAAAQKATQKACAQKATQKGCAQKAAKQKGCAQKATQKGCAQKAATQKGGKGCTRRRCRRSPARSRVRQGWPERELSTGGFLAR